MEFKNEEAMGPGVLRKMVIYGDRCYEVITVEVVWSVLCVCGEENV